MHASSARPVALSTLLLVTGATLFAACGSDDGTAGRDDAQPAGEAGLIVPDEGIGGIEIGDDLEAVTAANGEPDSSDESTNEANGQPQTTLAWEDPQLRVTLGGNDDVRQVETEDEQYRTREGSGVGSTVDELREANPEVECMDDAPRVCSLRDGSGTTSTDFLVEGDEVTRVVVARLED